jgi:hypothetical protein
LSEYDADLVILVADRNMEAAAGGLLSRPEALGITPVSRALFTHPERDPGCFLRGHEFLRPMQRRYARCLMMFDRAGSGREERTREDIERIVEERLSRSGWKGRCAAVVLDPELEAWAWASSPEVDACLGWQSRGPSLRRWLQDTALWPADAVKPYDPKAAIETALREVRKPRSSAVYGRLARQVSFERCADPAFLKFRRVLRSWFGAD